jgi:3-oxoacyl-[acyl-carrier protein] reductase
MAPPYSSIYSGTKGALDSITVSLSKELGERKIRVNALNPGLMSNCMTRQADPLGITRRIDHSSQ